MKCNKCKKDIDVKYCDSLDTFDESITFRYHCYNCDLTKTNKVNLGKISREQLLATLNQMDRNPEFVELEEVVENSDDIAFKIEHNFRKELQLFIERWGIQMQETMCMEEMSELTKELCKKVRGRENSKEIIEETADVLITALQMAEINGYDEVMNVVNSKMERALNKIHSQL